MQRASVSSPGDSSLFQGYLFSQPHQPFFLSGVLSAMVLMLMFALSHKGIVTLSISDGAFHGYGLIFLTFTQFFMGFLFTTFPRFCQSQPIERETYIGIFLLYQIGTLLFIAGALFFQTMVVIGVVVTLLANVWATYTLKQIYDGSALALRTDPFWILMAIYFGVASHLLWAVGSGIGVMGMSNGLVMAIATEMAMNMYLVFMVFAVAQRMVPFFSHSFEPKDPHLIRVVFVGLTLKTFFALMQWHLPEIAVDILLGLYVLREFLIWKLPIFTSRPILWILHLALFWIPVALLTGAMSHLLGWWMGSSFLFLQTHLLALGVVTTILIGFGTRVTLGHSGRPPEADTITKVLFWMTQLLLFSRLAYSLHIGLGWSAFWLFDLTITIWLLLFGIWSWRYGPILTQKKGKDD